VWIDGLAIVDRIKIHSALQKGLSPGNWIILPVNKDLDLAMMSLGFAVESRLPGDRHSFYRYHQTQALEHFAVSMTLAERIQVVAQCFDRYEEERKADDSRLREAMMRNIADADALLRRSQEIIQLADAKILLPIMLFCFVFVFNTSTFQTQATTM